MRDWIENLNPRERTIVFAGGLLSIVLVYWLGVLEPATKKAESLQRGLGEQREVQMFLEQAAAEVQQYRRSPEASAGGNRNRSLLALVDSSSKQSGINAYIKRIQPDGQTSVRLWIEDAPFDKLMQWVHQLESSQGVRTENAVIDRQDREGTVKARLTMERSKP